jgi:hemolysin III
MTNKTANQKEERLNTVSHLVGVLFGVFGFYFLLIRNSRKTDYATFSIIVYSFTFILMFIASSLYHHVSFARFRNKLRILDHICIYLLIAGTYTPVALITLINGNGWDIFIYVWSIAAIGALLKLFFTGKYEFVSLLLYLVMGWLIVLDFQNLLNHTEKFGRNLLFIGGGFYTAGIFFYAIEKIPYNHFIWHLFVLAGALSHWLFIFLDVI